MSFADYFTTTALNTTIGASIYIGPNMARDDVREALQQLAADGRTVYDDIAAMTTGPAGTLTNNSGVVTTVPSTGIGHRIDVPSNGRALAVFLPSENTFEGLYIDGDAALRSRKYFIISGVTSDTDTSPAGIAARELITYRSTIYGSSWQSSMGQFWSDVNGPTIQVRQSYDPSVAMSFVDRTGEEVMIIAGIKDSGIWFHVPDSEPLVEDHITDPGLGGGFGALTAADAQLRLDPFHTVNFDGLMLWHLDGGAAGGGGTNSLLLGPNCAILGRAAGVDGGGKPNGTPLNLIQNESGNTTRVGNTTYGTVINGAVVTFEKPPRLPTYTVATLPNVASHIDGMIIVTDETGGRVPAFSDGTNWRRVTDRAIVA